MDKFWCVRNRYFDNGKVTTATFFVMADKKPDSSMEEKRDCDEYMDYFDTFEEAERWAARARNA